MSLMSSLREHTHKHLLKREKIFENEEEAFPEKERHDFGCKGGHKNRGNYQQLMKTMTIPYCMDS
jgi:hypothetical protein